MVGTHSDDLLHLLLKVLIQHPGEQGREESREKPTLTSVTVKGRKHQTGKGLMLSQVRFQAHLLTYFISINIVILPFQQDSLRVIIWPHSLHPFFFG